MTRRLVTFNLDQLGEAPEYRPPAERVLDGHLRCRNRDIDSAKDGLVRAGVWESTPGTNRSIKGESWEYCAILAGMAEITEDGHAPITVRAGDHFIMKPGYTGTWRTLEAIRKIWVVV